MDERQQLDFLIENVMEMRKEIEQKFSLLSQQMADMNKNLDRMSKKVENLEFCSRVERKTKRTTKAFEEPSMQDAGNRWNPDPKLTATTSRNIEASVDKQQCATPNNIFKLSTELRSHRPFWTNSCNQSGSVQNRADLASTSEEESLQEASNSLYPRRKKYSIPNIHVNAKPKDFEQRHELLATSESGETSLLLQTKPSTPGSRCSEGVRPATIASLEDLEPIVACSPPTSVFSCCDHLMTSESSSNESQAEPSSSNQFLQFMGYQSLASSDLPFTPGSRYLENKDANDFLPKFDKSKARLKREKHDFNSRTSNDENDTLFSLKHPKVCPICGISLQEVCAAIERTSINSLKILQKTTESKNSKSQTFPRTFKDLDSPNQLPEISQTELHTSENRSDLTYNSEEKYELSVIEPIPSYQNSFQEQNPSELLPRKEHDSKQSLINKCINSAANCSLQQRATPFCWFRCSSDVRPATMASLDDDLSEVPIYHPSRCPKKFSLSSVCSCRECLLMQHQCSHCSDCKTEMSPILIRKFMGLPTSCRLPTVVPKVEDVRHLHEEKLPTTQRPQIMVENKKKDPSFEHVHESMLNKAGVIGVAGCMASFQKDSFDTSVIVQLSCDFPTEISTAEGIIVTPEIRCIIVDDVRPKRQYFVSMPTCFVNSQITDKPVLKVQYCSTNDSDKWQTLKSMTHEKDLFVEFGADEMGRFRCIVPRDECPKLSKNMISLVYLQHSAMSKQYKLVWCILDDLAHLEAKMWVEMTPRSMYERVLPSKTFSVGFNQGLHLLVAEDGHGHELFSRNLAGAEIWNKKFYQKIEFSVSKSIKFLEGRSFLIRNDKDNLLLEYSECIDLPGTPAKRNRSFIHGSESVRSISPSSSMQSLESLSRNSRDLARNKRTCSRVAKLVRSGSKSLSKRLSTKFKK